VSVEIYLETVGLIVLAIVAAALGKLWQVDFLTTTVAPGLFGIALGYLSGSARTQQRLEALRKAGKF